MLLIIVNALLVGEMFTDKLFTDKLFWSTKEQESHLNSKVPLLVFIVPVLYTKALPHNLLKYVIQLEALNIPPEIVNVPSNEVLLLLVIFPH